MKTKVRAPGKLIILGEYAVLDGAPALVAAVDRFARIKIETSPVNKFSVRSPTLGISEQFFNIAKNGNIQFEINLQKNSEKDLSFFTQTMNLLLQKKIVLPSAVPVSITLNTDDFFDSITKKKFGLGSSAAMITGLIAAWYNRINEFEDLANRLNNIFKLSWDAHIRAQGKIGSGIDIAAAVFGGILRYQLSEPGNPASASIKNLALPDDLQIIPVWTGKSASTTKMVKKVNLFRRESASQYRTVMNQLRLLAEKGCEAFQNKETKSFLTICGEYSGLLAEFGGQSGANIFSTEHRKIAEIVRRAGGIYKISGAGGGDFGIALTQSRSVAKKLSNNILRSGFNMIKLTPVFDGVSVE